MRSLRFCNFLSANMDAVYQDLAVYLSRALSVNIRAERGERFADFAQQRADFGILCAYPFSEFLQHRPDELSLLGAPVLQGLSDHPWPAYHSVILCRHDSPISELNDAIGTRVAYNEVISHSGFRALAETLDQHGLTHADFGTWVHSQSHANSLTLVRERRADIAAIDWQVWQRARWLEPELEQHFKPIGYTQARPNTPFVASTRLPPSLLRELREALLSLHQHPAGQAILEAAEQLRIGEVQAEAYHDYPQISQAVNRVFQGSALAPSAGVGILSCAY